MDTEQLKLILETIKGAGADAKAVAIAWLIVSCVPYLTGSLVAIVVARLIRNAVLSANRYEKGWKAVCDRLGMDTESYEPMDGCVRRVLKQIDEISS